MKTTLGLLSEYLTEHFEAMLCVLGKDALRLEKRGSIGAALYLLPGDEELMVFGDFKIKRTNDIDRFLDQLEEAIATRLCERARTYNVNDR